MATPIRRKFLEQKILRYPRAILTGLLFSSTVGFVPIGARTVLINLQMTRTDGAYDDGYADDLSLTLQSVPEPSGLVLVSSGIVGLIVYRIRRMLKSHLDS